MSDQIVDTIEQWSVDRLIPYVANARTHSDEQIAQVAASIREFGFNNPIQMDGQSGIIAGHCRLLAARKLGMLTVPVVVLSHLTDAQRRAYIIADNQLAENAGWNMEILSAQVDRLREEHFDISLLGFSEEMLGELLAGDDITRGDDMGDDMGDGPEDGGPGEPPVDPVSREGDVWIMGGHRLMCGDSTDAGSVALLMNGEKATLCHADPPYGMGKEKDGVQNDNLYGDKLDEFQMAWWKAFRHFLTDNASAYIWGNAEDLWRLWYVGGLNDSERLTFRNEIVWDKNNGQGMASEARRMFPTATERVIFFMLGEQGFNNNADNYWDGWEPIRSYLDGERQSMGWSKKDIGQITGTSDMFSHWFTRSQWLMMTRENYEKLQLAAGGDNFKREYDDLKLSYSRLKREFYATRAHFDNTHENMTDVWQFPRVQGEERHGHATPKPVDMICRAVKSSCPDGGLLVEPFSGSGTTIIAAERSSRRCYAMEISPAYVDVAVKRWQTMSGKVAVLESSGLTFVDESTARS